jgi:Co/Zn/Cd efflux system component
MADLLGSIGDIAAAMPWSVTGWHWIDQPIRRPGVS